MLLLMLFLFVSVELQVHITWNNMDHHGQMQEQKRISNKQDQNTNTKYTSDSTPKHTKTAKKGAINSYTLTFDLIT